MTPTLLGRDHFAAEFDRLARSLPGAAALRREAIDRFSALGFPTCDREEWRHTDVAPLSEILFRPASGTPNPNLFAGVARGPLRDFQIAFVNGRFSPAYSRFDGAAGVTVVDLADLLRQNPARLEPHLAKLAAFDRNPFAALNTALSQDGAFVHLAPGAAVDRPIHILFISSLCGEPTVTHPRILVVAEEGARATLVETFVGPSGGVYFTNAVTEISAAAGARIDFVKVQRESAEAFHVAAMHARLGRNASLTHNSISLGARLARNDFHAVLQGEGAEAVLNGLYEVTGDQLADHHTTVDHASPGGTSRELYKGILSGRSRGVFDGRIVVRPGAEKTNSLQLNKNLLLSKESRVHTKPQLEILARDVKCKHGATIGRLDPNLLFYLRSRGIGLEEARRLLIHAFACEIIDQVRIDAVRAQLGGCLSLMARGDA
jgi:Fe-S cluster assembly protein SufD